MLTVHLMLAYLLIVIFQEAFCWTLLYWQFVDCGDEVDTSTLQALSCDGREPRFAHLKRVATTLNQKDSYEISYASALPPVGWLRCDLHSTTLPLILCLCPQHYESELTQVDQHVHRTSSLLVWDLGIHKGLEDQIGSHGPKVSFYTKQFSQLHEFELSRVSCSRSFSSSYLVMNDQHWAFEYRDFLFSYHFATLRLLQWTRTRAVDHQLDLSLHYRSSSLSTSATCWFWLPEAYYQIWKDYSLN